ncbi:MAG TPA: class I SAM-dependent methyltransferase [Candidatus Eisenbacteria bacterium]|nr:class I SAM-dependent methyltransferase [Candidatus Eisenbacteria bacterium]
MAEFAVQPSDEPFDFRRQAATYGKFRRDYSGTLYDAIAARTGPAAGRAALDAGCGTGFVTRSLAARGWRSVGLDFSWPMLAEAHAAGPDRPLVRARGEALAIGSQRVGLVTCGTAFHWFAPKPALEEFARVLVPGGWVALFWRYPIPKQPHMAMVRDSLRDVDVVLPDAYEELRPHGSTPFAGSPLVDAVEERFRTTLEFTPQDFHGQVSTFESMRRFCGDRFAEFLDRLAERVARHPTIIREENEEFLYLARRPD